MFEEPGVWIVASFVLSWCGVLQASSMAVVFLSLPGPALPARRTMALQLALVAALAGVVALSHQASAPAPELLQQIEGVCWLLTGPVLLAFTERSLRGRSLSPLHFAPALVALAVCALGRQLPDEVLLYMSHQLGYSLAAVRSYRLADSVEDETRWWCRTWFAVLVAIHVAQVVRYLFTEVEWLVNVVPATMAVALLVASSASLRRLLNRRTAARRPSGTRKRGAGLGLEVQRLIEERRLFLDPELTVRDVASTVGAPRAEVSAAIQRELGNGFHELVGDLRVREAKVLLRRVDLQHLTIEAIGRRAGFKTRSTFYQRFRGQTGTTPSRYRLSDERHSDKDSESEAPV
ncbi:MAG: helix-turn-helix transcriptional regulator [Acidobacteriota bacterium]